MKTGDRVVCVKTAPNGQVIKDNIYPILDEKRFSCGCLAFVVNSVPPPSPTGIVYCTKHDSNLENNGDCTWFYSDLFAPIQTKREFISSEEFITVEETIDIPIPENA